MSQQRLSLIMVFVVVLILQATAGRPFGTDHLRLAQSIDFDRDCFAWDAQFADNRRLLVSNEPEVVNELYTPVLWHDRVNVDSATGPQSHRVFLWHVNGTRQRITIGITVENYSLDHPIRITDCRIVAGAADTGNTLRGVGIPVAKQGLDIAYLPPATLANPVIGSAGSTSTPSIREVSSWTIAPGEILGALVEFSIVPAAQADQRDLNYMVRVVACAPGVSLTGNDDLTEGQDGNGLYPLTPSFQHGHVVSVHTRGSWAHASIAISNRRHPVQYSPIPRYGYLTFPESNDLLMNREDSYDSAHASPDGNSGNWGVTYKLQIYTALPPEIREPRTIAMRFIGLHTLDGPDGRTFPYAGAVRIGNGGVQVIPALAWGSAQDATSVVWAFQTPPGALASQSFELMHAGGACLPVGVCFLGVDPATQSQRVARGTY